MRLDYVKTMIISLLLSILLLGTVRANPSLDLGTASGNPCEQIIIPITLTNDLGIEVSATSTDIGYNATYLIPIESTIGPAGEDAGKSVIDNIVEPGLYRVAVMSTSNLNPIADGIVAYVNFEISCNAPAVSYQLSNSPSCSTPQGEAIDTDGSNGSIEVTTGSTTTTTMEPSTTAHIETCLGCHLMSDLHERAGHSNCTQCHEGATQAGIVEPSNCILCHPLGNSGDCNLVDFHDPSKGGNCLVCHIDCDDGTTSHIEECLVCHLAGDLHGISTHTSNCAQCHDGTPQTGNVKADKCIVCHPLGYTGDCKLVDFHAPGRDGECLECHMNCSGGEITTTTVTPTSTTTIDSNTTSVGGETTTTTAGGPSSTTTVPPSGHTGVCLSCHVVNDLHDKEEHDDCTQCHDGTPQAGNVKADKCVVCHPTGAPSKCNLADFHGVSCLECHKECVEDTVTTTTIVPAPTEHFDTCLECHYAEDLHAREGHKNSSNCNTQCHDGDPQTGNVGADKCIVCHLKDDPGKCSLTNYHGISCLECHKECVEDTVTTTTIPPAPSEHIGICLECHYVNDVHAHAGHNDCTQCHDGEPGPGNVGAEQCIVCHPFSDPGKCSLANYHGATCLECHFDCTDNTTTTTIPTTTTTIEDFPNPVTIDIELKPDSVFRSHLVPFVLIMFIEGSGSNFNETTMVSFEGNAICPPFRLVLSPTSLLVLSIINPAGLEATGVSKVAVNVNTTVDSGEGESFEEVGSGSLSLIMLPFILDEERGK